MLHTNYSTLPIEFKQRYEQSQLLVKLYQEQCELNRVFSTKCSE